MGRKIAVLILGFALSACSTTPYTHRHQFLILSEKEEIDLGKKAFAEVQDKGKISHDAKQNAMLERVGKRIALAAQKSEYQWEFALIDSSKTVNAFALPGGKVAFYSGIMPICQDENGIAVVMGHEVAHALARHGAERMSQGMLAQLGAQGVAIAVGNKAPIAQKGILDAYGLGVQVGALLPFGRKQESEADHIGLILMAKAGYDPHHAVDFWKRMAQTSKDGEKPPEFLSTHPSDERRIKQIESWIPEAMQHYQKQP